MTVDNTIYHSIIDRTHALQFDKFTQPAIASKRIYYAIYFAANNDIRPTAQPNYATLAIIRYIVLLII